MQSLSAALYPVFRHEFALTFFQIGVDHLRLPGHGLVPPAADRYGPRQATGELNSARGHGLHAGRPRRCSPSPAPTLLILVSVAVIGVGSAVFHPEASRVARAASGGRHGFAQSLFQVGGNFGQSLGPLLAAFIVVPFGQRSVAAFTLLALAAIGLLAGASRLVRAHRAAAGKAAASAGPTHPRKIVVRTLVVLIVMLFSKVVYLASINSYYTFYLIQTFGVSIQSAQVFLFVFLASVAAGTLPRRPAGRPLRRAVRHLGLDPRGAAVHAAPAASRTRRHGRQLASRSASSCRRPSRRWSSMRRN